MSGLRTRTRAWLAVGLAALLSIGSAATARADELSVVSAQALSSRLQRGEPPVHLGERLAANGILSINPQTLREQDDAVLVQCVIRACRSKTKRAARPTPMT